MKRIRLGNTIDIVWEIFLGKDKDKGKYDLTGKKLTIYLVSAFDRIKISGFTTEFNVLRFTFEGKDQKHAGRYQLTLVENEGSDDTRTLNLCDAFELVRESCKETDDLSEITLTSSFDALRVYPIIPQVGPNGNWWVDGVDTGNASGTAPDWNASTYKKGHIKNRTHHMNDHLCHYFNGAPIKISKPSGVGYVLLTYDTDLGDKFIRIEISEVESKTHEFFDAMGMPLVFSWDAGNSTINVESFAGAIEAYVMRAYYSSSAKSYDEYFVTLDNGFIPESVARKSEIATINGKSITKGGNIVIEGAHNIGSIDLFEQIIAQKQNYDLTLEDKEAILNGKVITTSVGNGTVPTISINSMGENAVVLIFHFNERLYEMFVMWTDTLCYINGVLSFTQATKLFADSELSETSENSVQNKVVTERLSELSENVDRNYAQIGSVGTDVGELAAKVYSQGAELTELSAELESNGQLIEDLQNMKIDKEADDYYPQLSVGTADNLAGVDEVDSEFGFRRSGGGAITDGVARVQSIKGNSVVYNQIMKPAVTIIESNLGGVKAITTIGSRAIKIQGEYNESVGDRSFYISGAFPLEYGIEGHIYATIISGNKLTRLTAFNYGGATSNIESGFIFKKQGDKNIALVPALPSNIAIGTSVNEEVIINLIDLTQMFGSGNEPTTIEEFYQRMPMGVDLNAYNAGEVINMSASGIKSVGRNAWDEEWEVGGIGTGTGASNNNTDQIRAKYAFPIIGGKTYYIKNPASVWAFFYNGEMELITCSVGSSTSGYASLLYNTTFTPPADARYMKFYVVNTYGTTYNHDICINISDTEFNGQYEAYREATEDLSLVAKYFPNGMRSAGTAHDEIRYNKTTNKWEKVVRIGEVDMGTLLWDGNPSAYFAATIQNMIISSNRLDGLLCKAFPLSSVASLNVGSMIDGAMLRYNNQVIVKYPSAASASAFKASLQGVILYYELAEPIVTEIEEKDFNLDYSVWNGGTEKAIAEGKSSALAADITYGFNAVGLIKQLRSLVESMAAKLANL